MDGIYVVDDVKMAFNCHIDFAVLNSLFLKIDKTMKKMFLIIPDSVMNSNI